MENKPNLELGEKREGLGRRIRRRRGAREEEEEEHEQACGLSFVESSWIIQTRGKGFDFPFHIVRV